MEKLADDNSLTPLSGGPLSGLGTQFLRRGGTQKRGMWSITPPSEGVSAPLDANPYGLRVYVNPSAHWSPLLNCFG